MNKFLTLDLQFLYSKCFGPFYIHEGKLESWGYGSEQSLTIYTVSLKNNLVNS